MMSLTLGSVELISASHRGDAPEVERLLAGCDLDVNASTAEGLTALHCAAKAGHEAAVSLLLKDKGIVTKLETKNGETALQLAQAGEHAGIVDLFLEADGCAFAGTVECTTPRSTKMPP
jgi:ankyrin repeat protein